MSILLPKNLVDVVQGMQNPDRQIQAAGVDLTVHSIQKFVGEGLLAVYNSDRKLPRNEEVHVSEGSFYLAPGGYQLRYNEVVNVPLDAAAITLPRSSLMRSGATLHSALWDPGYVGRGMGLLTVTHPIKIEQNARVAQIIFFSLTDSTNVPYEGAYQGEGIDSAKTAD